MQKPLTVWNTKYSGKLIEMGIPDHLICLLRNLYAGQEETVRTRHGNGLVPNWERSTSSCILSPYLINLYAEYIMRNAQLDEMHKLETRLSEEISPASDMQIIPL